MTKNTKMIEPFCVDSSNLTVDEIRNLHKMCLDAGAGIWDNVEEWLTHRTTYNFLGVDDDNETRSRGRWEVYDDIYTYSISKDEALECYNGNVIAFEEVEAYLGLSAQSEAEVPEEVLNLKDVQSPCGVLKWTEKASEEGIQPCVGMVVYSSVLSEEGLLRYYGKDISVVEIDGEDCVVDTSDITPCPEDKSPEEEQRQLAVKVLEELYGLSNLDANGAYEKLFNLGILGMLKEY